MELTSTLKLITARRRDLDDLGKYLREVGQLAAQPDKNPAKALSLIAKAREIGLRAVGTGDVQPELLAWCDDQESLFRFAVKERETRFGLDLSGQVAAIGLQLAGNYPSFTAGLFAVDVDVSSARARLWYGPQQEELQSCAADPKQIASKLSSIQSKLGSGLSQTDFLKQLEAAFEQLAKRLGTDRLPIVALLFEMAITLQSAAFRSDPRKENYSTYSRADFSYDLARYARNSSFRLSVATRAETKSRKSFLWIPDIRSGGGSDYSHVSLKGN